MLLEPARGKVTGFFGLKPPRTYLGPVFYGQVRSDLVSLQIIYPINMARRQRKKRIFYGQADCKRLPHPPPYGQLFVKFYFGVFFILDYDSMCSDADFTQEKSIFMQLQECPIPPLTAAHLIVGGYFSNSTGHSHSL